MSPSCNQSKEIKVHHMQSKEKQFVICLQARWFTAVSECSRQEKYESVSLYINSVAASFAKITAGIEDMSVLIVHVVLLDIR